MKPEQPRRIRRARQRLLLALGLVVLAQVVAGVVIDYGYPLLRFPSLRGHLNRLSSLPSSPQVVFLGSSRFGGGFHEQEIASLVEKECRLDHGMPVLNAAVPGGEHAAQRFVLKHLLAAGVRPRLVVLEVSPDFVNWYKPFDHLAVVRQHRWEDMPRHLLGIMQSSQGGRLFTARFVPLYQHRAELWKLVGISQEKNSSPELYTIPRVAYGPPPPRQVFTGSLRWEEILKVQTPKLDPDVPQIIQQGGQMVGRWLRKFQICQVSRRHLEATIRHCQDQGIEVLLVSPPVTEPHRAQHTVAIEQPFQALLAEMQREFGCRYIDARDWVPDTLFLDTHHLTGVGSQLFSRLFVQRVLAPWQKQANLARH